MQNNRPFLDMLFQLLLNDYLKHHDYTIVTVKIIKRNDYFVFIV